MRFQILGPLRVWRGDVELALGSSQQRTLLGVLLLRANHAVSRGQLTDALWGTSPPASAPNLVHGYVAGLRRVLEPKTSGRRTGFRVLTSAPGGYLLRVAEDDLDLLAFRRDAGAARQAAAQGSVADACQLWNEALRQWQGPALADADHSLQLHPMVTMLNQERLTAAADLADVAFSLGRPTEVVAALEPLTEVAPYDEALHARLMRALAATGRQADALETYQRLSRQLRDVLGIDPSAQLREAHLEVLRQRTPMVSAEAMSPNSGNGEFPRPTSSYESPWRGPRPTPWPLIGRDAELATVRDLLDTRRLLVLTGPAGVGKTALALAAAATTRLRDGVVVVELAEVGDVAGARNAMLEAASAEVVGGGQTQTQVVDALRKRRMLLLLDNAEHLADVIAPYLDAILRACPGVTTLVTSRTALGVQGETVIPVDPLPCPQWPESTPDGPVSDAAGPATISESPAVALFCERAGEVQPGFELTARNATAVAALCRAVDGLPLGLEIAAAWLRVMDVSHLRAHLDDLLLPPAPPRRSGPPHHRSLDAALRWSTDLLASQTRELLANLALIAGSFPLDAAIALDPGSQSASSTNPDLDADNAGRAAALRHLAALVDHSLLQVEHQEQGTRYRMLEPVRQFASRLLHPEQTRHAQRRLVAYCATHAARFEQSTTDNLVETLTARYQADLALFRSALAVAVKQPELYQTAVKIVVDLQKYWTSSRRYSREGLDWVDRLLPDRDGLPDDRQRSLLTVKARLENAVGNDHLGVRALTEALPLAEPGSPTWLYIQAGLGTMRSSLLDDGGLAVLAEAASAMEASEQDAVCVGTVSTHARALLVWGHYQEAERRARTAVARWRHSVRAAAEPVRCVDASPFVALAEALLEQGKPLAALAEVERSIDEISPVADQRDNLLAVRLACHLVLDNLDAAQHAAEQLVDASGALLRLRPLVILAARDVLVGDLDRSVARLRRMFERAVRTRPKTLHMQALAVLVRVWRDSGHTREAEALARRLLVWHDAMGPPVMPTMWRFLQPYAAGPWRPARVSPTSERGSTLRQAMIDALATMDALRPGVDERVTV